MRIALRYCIGSASGETRATDLFLTADCEDQSPSAVAVSWHEINRIMRILADTFPILYIFFVFPMFRSSLRLPVGWFKEHIGTIGWLRLLLCSMIESGAGDGEFGIEMGTADAIGHVS